MLSVMEVSCIIPDLGIGIRRQVIRDGLATGLYISQRRNGNPLANRVKSDFSTDITSLDDA